MGSVIRVHSVALLIILCVTVQVAHAQEHGPTDDSSPRTGPEIYAAIFAFGSLSQNRNLNVGGESLPSTTVKDGAGGGFKAGVFPAFTGYVLGIQAESFGLGHGITTPASMGPSGVQSARGTLLAWTTMVSLLVQYPGRQFKPYAGIGVGWSTAYMVDAALTNGATTQTGTFRDTSVALQYVAGLRTHLAESVFVFGEYKYFTSRYQWSGSLEPALDFRTHMVAIGVGLAF